MAGVAARFLEAPEAEALAGLYAGLVERLTRDRGRLWGGRSAGAAAATRAQPWQLKG